MKATVKAPAKINLTLDIVGRRADGYHDVAMVMQTVSLYDTVTVAAADGEGDGITVSCPAYPDVPADDSNIVCKAARAFFTATGVTPVPLKIAIEKDIQTVLSDHARRCTYLPVCLPVWEHYGRSSSITRQRLHGYFHDGKIDIFSTSGNRFKFCNAFSATHSHDTLYYLLNAFTQLGLKPTRDEVVLLGSVAHQQWIADHLGKYVEHIVVEPLPDKTLPLDLTLLTNRPQP